MQRSESAFASARSSTHFTSAGLASRCDHLPELLLNVPFVSETDMLESARRFLETAINASRDISNSAGLVKRKARSR